MAIRRHAERVLPEFCSGLRQLHNNLAVEEINIYAAAANRAIRVRLSGEAEVAVPGAGPRAAFLTAACAFERGDERGP